MAAPRGIVTLYASLFLLLVCWAMQRQCLASGEGKKPEFDHFGFAVTSLLVGVAYWGFIATVVFRQRSIAYSCFTAFCLFMWISAMLRVVVLYGRASSDMDQFRSSLGLINPSNLGDDGFLCGNVIPAIGRFRLMDALGHYFAGEETGSCDSENVCLQNTISQPNSVSTFDKLGQADAPESPHSPGWLSHNFPWIIMFSLTAALLLSFIWCICCNIRRKERRENKRARRVCPSPPEDDGGAPAAGAGGDQE